MQNKNRNIEDTLDWLQATLNASGLPQGHISEVTGVHQSQVSRILSGRAKRLSKNVITLCKFAENLHKTDRALEDIPPILSNALLQTWDGTLEHAEGLARVIYSLKGLPPTHKQS